MASVVWSAQALSEVREIVSYIRRDSPAAAQRVGRRLKESTRRLAEFPLSGRIIPELPDYDFREVIVGAYRIIYEVQEDRVEIFTVIHGSRDLPTLFLPPAR